MRMRFSRARAASKAGMMTERKWSYGILSRKKNDSVGVIASITATVSGGAGGGGFKLVDQLGETGQSVLARDRQQAAFGEVLLFGREHLTGALAQHLAQIVEVLRGHALSPANRRVRRGAISSSGSTAEQRPACATWPGMPHTTLVGSSGARMLPPAAAIACAPRKPSEPMPVSTRPSTFGPQTSAAEENSGSTAGLQKLTSGPSSSAMTAMPSRRTTDMCRPPGAR